MNLKCHALWLVVGLLLHLPGIPSKAQELTKTQRTSLNQAVGEGLEGQVPGIAVGIVHKGKVVFEKYVGLADLNHGIPIGPETRFNIASNAKQYAALAILQLVHSGKVKLDDDLRTLLPNFFKQVKNPITLGQLLNHSSGVRDVYDLWALKGQTWWQMFIGNSDALALLKAQEDLNFTPGSRYLYSNSNYLLLTEVIKKVSGQSFSEFAHNLFKGLGMKHSQFLTNYMTPIPNRARSYGQWSGWAEYPTITEIHGDGGLYSTLNDQLLWEQIVQKQKSQALPQAVIQMSQGTIPGSDIKNYGFGLEFGIYRGLKYQFHQGNTGAYNAFFARFPSEQFAIVAMSNNNNISPFNIAMACVEIVLGKALAKETHPAGPAQVGTQSPLKQLVGDYELSDGTLLKVYVKDGQLFRGIHQRDPVKLIHEKGNLYTYETIKQLKMAFSSDSSGQSILTLYHPNQKPKIGKKLADAPLSNEYMASLKGRYFNRETGVEITLTHDKDALFKLQLRGNTLQAHLLRKDWLQLGGYRITVVRDSQQVVSSLLVSQGRIRNVAFKRIEKGASE